MKYEHIVYLKIKNNKQHVCIDRIFENGTRHFMTHYELPEASGDQEGFDLMSKVAEWLGNSTLIDSPDFREHIGVNE